MRDIMGGSKEGLQYVFAETLGFGEKVKAIGVRIKPGRRIEITGRLLIGNKGEVVDTKDLLKVWYYKKIHFADRELGIVDWEGVRVDRKRSATLNPRRWGRNIRDGLEIIDRMMKFNQGHLSYRTNNKIEVLGLRFGIVLEKLALIALVNERDVADLLGFYASGILINEKAVTKENVANLLMNFQGDEGLKVGSLSRQAAEAYRVIEKNMPPYEEFSRREYPGELLAG